MKVNPVLIAFVVIALLAPIASLFRNSQIESRPSEEEMLWI
ncbi:hypothetical protein [Pedobacter heparinus]|nr:hypothetical protein [Pedobacter heparinus]